MSNYLYRGMNEKMFNRYKGKLTPRGKVKDASLYPSKFLAPSEKLFPGMHMKNAIDKHQNPNRYEEEHFKSNSAYLSFSPIFERASFYATREHSEIGYVFTIDREKLKKYSIEEYNISDIATTITTPEDKEVLLLSYPLGESICNEVIVKIEKVFP